MFLKTPFILFFYPSLKLLSKIKTKTNPSSATKTPDQTKTGPKKPSPLNNRFNQDIDQTNQANKIIKLSHKHSTIHHNITTIPFPSSSMEKKSDRKSIRARGWTVPNNSRNNYKLPTKTWVLYQQKHQISSVLASIRKK